MKKLSANTTLSHYRIVEKLGAGGMGEVWLAEDTRLKRKVALKLLPAELTADAERVRRFEQEAQAASALNHPNIITVHDIGESETGRFIVMELVTGRTLRGVMAEDNSLATALSLGQQMAKALSAAHAAGITHRDVKPDNIMVRDDGYVKVLDFGLARLLPTGSGEDAATLAQQTTPGTVMGTVAYMSPEQARGETVSHPSDVFALGIVLYELATGRHPFRAETLVGYLHAITLQEPPPLTQWKPELPAALNALILQMLDKDARQRPTASEVAQTLQDIERRGDTAELPAGEDAHDSSELEGVAAQTLLLKPTTMTATGAKDTAAENAQPTTPDKPKVQKWWIASLLSLVVLAGGFFGYRYFTASQQIESIAVLPFVNASGNADVEYLSDGMTETLISSLSQLPKLNVKARSSVFRYKGKEFDLPKIAQELKVQAILTGRVVQRGEQLTLSLELVDARTENALWSEQYNRRQTDLVTLQSELARDVSGKLKAKLSGADEQKLAKTYTENSAAYQLYLKGRFHWNKRERRDFQQAIEYFKQAIALDQNYALAYAGLADSYAVLSTFGYAPPAEGMTKAREFARKALTIDDSLAEPHTTLGLTLLSYDYDFTGAEREYKRAIELNPNYATAHQWYGELLTSVGRFDEAIAAYRRGLEIEPLSLPLNWDYGRCFYLARKYDEAITQHLKTLELDPGFSRVHRTLSEVYRVKGDHAKAVEEQVKNFELSGEPQNAALIREAFAKGGWNGYLRLVTAKNSPLKDRHYVVARAYLELGEKDKAFAELDKAYENRESPLQWLKVEPQLDPLRSDPRFQELLKKVGFP